MVTASAAVRANLAHPSSIVPCPGEIQIGSRLIPNYDKSSLSAVPLLGAFAQSCNTTFAHLASQMGPSDLAYQAAAMGLGGVSDIPGLANVSGSVPIAPTSWRAARDGSARQEFWCRRSASRWSRRPSPTVPAGPDLHPPHHQGHRTLAHRRPEDLRFRSSR